MKHFLGTLFVAALVAGTAACPDVGLSDPTSPPVTTSNCEEHSDCGAGYTCQSGECRPGECVASLQPQCNAEDTPAEVAPYCCAVWENCNVLGECVANPDAPVGSQCQTDTDCSGLGQFCSGGNCFETGGRDACTKSFQCPAGERCDRTVFLCVPDNGGCTFAEQFPELACETSQLCDAETGFCLDPGAAECTAETASADCRPNELCDNLGRCVQCITSDDCGPGTDCNVGTGSCYSVLNRCETDDDCTTGKRCSPASNECVTPQCLTDNDCEDSRAQCDTSTFTCFLPAATCNETDEPNDSAGSATPITLAGYSGTLCRGNTDFLSFPVQGGKRYRATVTFSDYDVAGVVIEMRNTLGLPTASDTLGSFENAGSVSGVADADESGNFLLRITGAASEADQWSYAVTLEESDAPPQVSCSDETANGIEPNDTFATAHEIVTGTSYAFARCGISDVDFYKIAVPPQNGVEIAVEMAVEEGDLELALYSAENGSSIDTATTGASVEKVDVAEGPSELWLKVYRYSGDSDAATNQTYSVFAKAIPRPASCDADINEPDTTPAQAGILNLATTVEALRCGNGDVDHFALTIPANTAGTLRLDFTHSQGDLKLDLLDGEGAVVATSNQSSNTVAYEAVSLPFAATETTYVARVRLNAGTGSTPQAYTLSASTYDASTCTASEPVSNNTFATGTCVGAFDSDLACASSGTVPTSGPALTACADASTPGCGTLCGPADPDYFRVGKLNNGQLLRAKLIHAADVGAMGLALVRQNGDGSVTELVSDLNGSSSDTLELTLVSPTLGDSQVREYGVVVKAVAAADYAAQPYSLEIEVGAPCVADAREPNETVLEALSSTETELTSGTAVEATLCGSDVDVFKIFLQTGQSLNATLSELDGATIDILSSSGEVLPCAQGIPEAQTALVCPADAATAPTAYTSPMVARYTATSTNLYFVRVKRQPNGGIGTYTLSATVTGP
ncbi:MAG: hypothetical protein ACO3JL_01560 [Myxococcota bacterium]